MLAEKTALTLARVPPHQHIGVWFEVKLRANALKPVD
jgi:hypothetical protein